MKNFCGFSENRLHFGALKCTPRRCQVCPNVRDKEIAVFGEEGGMGWSPRFVSCSFCSQARAECYSHVEAKSVTKRNSFLWTVVRADLTEELVKKGIC